MPSPTSPSIPKPLHVLVLTTSPATPLPPPLQGTDLALHTPYYKANLPLWHDSIFPSPKTIEEWEREWQSPEAGEVVQSIGAWVVVSQKPSASMNGNPLSGLRALLRAVRTTLSHHQNSTTSSYTTSDPLLLLLGMPQPLLPLHPISPQEWEDLALDCGNWEYIDSEATGKNEFGEKVGLDRLKEALEANEWDGEGGTSDDDYGDFERELSGGQDVEVATNRGRIEQDEEDTIGMREPILKGDDEARNSDTEVEKDIQVEELETMMLRMQAIKGSLDLLISITLSLRLPA
ncbi:MAG: hypothetical protein Q9220_005334 [cf. Caloplaca sp. 1 TL-2023]